MQIISYLQLRSIIIRQFVRELPWFARIVLFSIAFLAVLLLYKIHITLNLRNSLIFITFYTAISLSIPMVKIPERVLLSNLYLPAQVVGILRKIYLPVIALALHPVIGSLCLLLELVIIAVQSTPLGINSIFAFIGRIPSPFLVSSLSYISVYRRGGIATLPLLYSLMIAGYLHDNQSLTLAAFSVLLVFWGMAPLNIQEAPVFITIFPKPELFLRHKTKEAIMNLAILALPVWLFLAYIHQWWFIPYSVLVIAALIPLIYIRFSYYRNSIMSGIITLFFLFMSIFAILTPILFPVLVFMSAFFYHKAKNNLLREFYVRAYNNQSS